MKWMKQGAAAVLAAAVTLSLLATALMAASKNWLDAAREGDAFALEELDRWSDVYALGLSNVLALLAPRVIALGGGVALAGETILKPIREKLKGRCFISMQDRWNVEICQTGEMAVLIGAALYARDGFSSL